MTFQPWAFLLIEIPPVFFILLLGWKMKRERDKSRNPIKEPLLRPPGESCRLKIGELDEELPIQLLMFVAPVFVSFGAYYAHANFITCVVLSILSVAFTLFITKRLWDVAIKIGNYRLGFEGERAVGQELNELLSFGCKVYHDVQFDGYNIDHVIVAPSGVYAVETKTRRKGREKDSHRVRYDGHRLIFPKWEDVKYLEQAQRNAKNLHGWIHKTLVERVWVVPILTLPGWFVERLEEGKVNVLNHKEIVDFIKARNSQATLSPELIQRISSQLERENVILQERFDG